jgi:hypothetical protein
MIRLSFLSMLLLMIAAATSGNTSPVDGKQALGRARIEAADHLVFEKEFRGGERACVIVKGDHEPVVDLSLSVYDAKGVLVARDAGAGDYVAVIWYPPRDARFRIEIVNPGTQFNQCYISLK